MKLNLKFIILNILLLNTIKTIIVLPLYRQEKIINITSSYQLINNNMQNYLYTIIKIGNPKQNIELIITEEDLVFSIRKLKCISKKYYYNISNSKSFKNITNEKKDYNRFYQSTEAEEIFYFYEDKNNINEIIINNLGFVYENEKNNVYNDDKSLKYNCAILSLNLFRNNIANNDYNFIIELKKLGYINNYIWSIKYLDENNNNNLEGYLIIGDYPHVYEKEKYDKLNLRSSLNNMNEKGWNLEFKNITIDNNTILSHYMTGIISFSNSYIKGTEEYKSKIENIFFREYKYKGICFEDSTNTHYSLYYCKKNKNEFNEKSVSSFPKLYFYHAEFNYTFEFTGNDLFLEKNGIYYFLIIFDRYDYITWSLGKIFLNKYQLIFDHISKKINFYINKIEQKNISSEGDNIYINNKILIIIILGSIAVISFIIGLIIGKIKFGNKKRNKKANELDNEEYLINNKKKESIIDSEDATNISNTSEENNQIN